MFNNKKGYSTGFTWVFALVSMFGLGILFIVFNQVFLAYLNPTIIDMVNNTADIPQETKDEIYEGIDKYMTFWAMLPFILFFTIIIYMVVAAIRREGEERYL